MQVKKHHHILPRLYLRGFAARDNASFIWAYTKTKTFKPGGVQVKHNPARIPIAKAAMVPFAYGYTKMDGTFDSDTFENELEKLEKPADPIFKKIRDRIMIDQDEKELFASYLVMMHRRIPELEEKVKKNWADVLASSPEIALLRSPEFLSRLTETRRTELEIALARYESGPIKEVLLNAMITDGGEVLAYLRKMRWRFLVADGPSRFITGDHPVFTSGLGLIKIPAELTFPVSSEVTLHASWQPGSEGFITAPEKYIRQLNHRIAGNSQEVYYSRCEEWVVKILNKRDHPIYLLDVSGNLPLLWRYRDHDVPREWLA